MRLHLSVILTGLALLLTGCGQQQQTASGKLQVVATTGMIGDAAQVIGGDKVELATLMGPGVDPHLFKASKGDLDLLGNADVIFYNGLHLEAKMAEVLKRMTHNRATVAVAEVIDDSLLRYPADYEGMADPHVWFDVSLWIQVVETMSRTLAKVDTVHAAEYMSNGRRYVDSLQRLHQWVREQIATIPESQRVLVTAHDAFGYFGQVYGIEVKGLQGISTVTEAGLYDVTEMVDMLVSRGVKAVFVESSVPRKAIASVADGCRARGHEVVIGGELFSDAMGAADTPKGTYLGMVRHNVHTVVEALK